MEESTEVIIEAKKSGGVGSFIAWTVVVLILYFLSLGPVMLWITPPGAPIHPQTPTEKILKVVYAPWWWAYRKTPLEKPLAMYLHFWLPEGTGQEE